MSLLSNHEVHSIFSDNANGTSSKWQADLFLKLRPLVISRIKKFRSFSHVEDLEQEFNLALWTSIKTFDCHRHFDFYRWSNWHFANASRDFQKKYRPLKSINLSGLNVKWQENVVLVKEVLSCKMLSNREQKILYMSLLEEHTLTSISQELNVSVERVRILKKRSIQKVKDYMEANDAVFSSEPV